MPYPIYHNNMSESEFATLAAKLLICLIFTGRLSFFFFYDSATTEIYTLSLHDALPISMATETIKLKNYMTATAAPYKEARVSRSEEHTSELQSRGQLVCRLLLEKKKKPTYRHSHSIKKKQTTQK